MAATACQGLAGTKVKYDFAEQAYRSAELAYGLAEPPVYDKAPEICRGGGLKTSR